MASLVQHVAGLACPPLSGATRRPGASVRPSALVCGTYVLSKDEKERERMRTLFDEASERCRTAPMEGITFSPEDLESAVETTDIDTDIGSLIKGTVFMTTSNGAFIDIQSKATAFLPIDEACLLDIDHIEEAGIRPGLVEQFMIIDENPNDETLILSLQSIQQDLAWERCRQLQAEDVVITGKHGEMGCLRFLNGDTNDVRPAPTSASVRSFSTASTERDARSGSDLNNMNASDLSAESIRRTQYPSFTDRPSNLRLFAFSELKSATHNFSRSLMVGEGGFGCVYRGVIKNSDEPTERIEITVKQLNRKGVQVAKDRW